MEPDTIIVTRNIKDDLTISKIILGSKISRMTASGDGISSEQVPENERNLACLSEPEILKLASIGVAQDKLWGAGRDIEWAVINVSYLLQ